MNPPDTVVDAAQAEAMFQQAVQKHQRGDLAAARELYETVLHTFRQHHHALHLLGVIASVQGEQFLARRLIQSSLAIAPDDADPWSNLAQVQLHLGDHAECVASCDRAIGLQGANARTHLTRAKALRHLGRHAEALADLDVAQRLQPGLPDVHAERGLCLHHLAEFAKALQDYDEAMRLRGPTAELLNNRGHARFALGQGEAARADIDRALELDPNLADAHYHLGLLLQHEQHWAEAADAYRRAVALHPAHVQALVRLAYVVKRGNGSPQESIAALDRALRIQPGHAEALAARGGLLAGARILSEALADYDRAAELAPDDAKIHSDRGECLLTMKRPREAADSFRRALALGGDEANLRYVLASLGEAQAPGTAPKDYVVNLFDWYADTFDGHLVGRLEYRTPEELCAEIDQVRARKPLEILDLGCGTGLCGPLLKPWASRLVGVDLSPKMLEVAGRRGVYDELACGDLSQFMAGQAARFDVVVSTDVFIYVGALEDVFANARAILRPGGLFAFSVESSESGEVLLRPSRRYAHSLAYLRRLSSASGFAVVTVRESVIRNEGGEGVAGLLVILQVPAPAAP